MATDFLQKYPEPSSIDLLQSEKDKKDFVLAFRDIIRKHAEIQIYEDYNDDADDLGMTEQQFMDFRSKYLDIHDTFVPSDMPSALQAAAMKRQAMNGWRMWISALNFCTATLSMWLISSN